MAVLSSLFNIGTQYPNAPPQGTTVQSQKLAEEISPFYKDLLAKSQALYNQQTEEGFTPYTAPTMARFSPEQQQSFEGIQGLVGSQKPLYDEAINLTRGTMRQFTPQTAQALMNPYQQAVTDVEKRAITEKYESETLPELRAQASMIQPYGGSRQAILEGMASDNQQRLLADVQAKGSLTAYNDAQSLFADQIKREGAAAGQLPTLGSASYKTQAGELGALQAVGEEKQKQSQSALDEAYRSYLEEKRFPETSMGQYQAVIQGFPALKQDITRSAPPPQPSMANQLIGGLGTIGSLYGAYGGFSDGGFGSALPGYGPVNQKEGSGLTTILPRANGGGGLFEKGYEGNPNYASNMAEGSMYHYQPQYNPYFDMSSNTPEGAANQRDEIGSVKEEEIFANMEQQRALEEDRYYEAGNFAQEEKIQAMIDRALIPNSDVRSRRADQIIKTFTEEEYNYYQNLAQSIINEDRTIARDAKVDNIKNTVGSGLQSLQEGLATRNIIPRQTGGPASGLMIKYNYPRSQHKGPIPVGSSFSDEVKGGLVPVNYPIQSRKNLNKVFQTPKPTPVAAETTQQNTQLLPSTTTNRVDPREQPAYTGVIGAGGLVDITDDGLQVFQKTQQGILNRSLYGGILEGGNPALASTPGEEIVYPDDFQPMPRTDTVDTGMSPTIAGMLERSPLVTTDASSAPSDFTVQTGQDKYGNTIGDTTGTKDYYDLNYAAQAIGQDTFMYGDKLMQTDGGYLRGHPVNPFISNKVPQDQIINPHLYSSYQSGSPHAYNINNPRKPDIFKESFYNLPSSNPIGEFAQDVSTKYSYYDANKAAQEAGSPTFMYGDKLMQVDAGYLQGGNMNPFISNKVPENWITAGVQMGSPRVSGINLNSSPREIMRAQPNAPQGLNWDDQGRRYSTGAGRAASVRTYFAGGGQIISRKGGGLVDLPVVRRQANATVLSPADQELVNTFRSSNDAAERDRIRQKLQGKIDLGYNFRDRGTVFRYINDTLNNTYDSITKLEIPENISEEVKRILNDEEYSASNINDMEKNIKKILNVNEINPALSGSQDFISGKKQQDFIEGQPTSNIQKYEKGKQVITDAMNLGVKTTLDVSASLASLLETSIKDKKETNADGEEETDNATVTKNEGEIVNESLAANNAALNVLDQNGLLNKTKDSSLLNYKNRLTEALANSRNKNAAVVKAIKAQDKRIKDRINQAPEAIRMEIFARMAQGFASMATSASPPAQAFLEQIPSFVEDTTAIGRGQREKIENLEDLSVESARAEAALADSEFTQETAIAAFELDQAAIQQKERAALIESVGMEAFGKASDFIKDVVGLKNTAIYGNARIALIEHVIRNGPRSLTDDVVNKALALSPDIPKVEKQSILERIKGLVN